MKRILTDQRSSLSDDHVEWLVTISCESRRMFPGQAWKIVELSSDIEEMIPVVRAAAKKRKAKAELEAQTLLKKKKSSSSKDQPQESAMDLTE